MAGNGATVFARVFITIKRIIRHYFGGAGLI